MEKFNEYVNENFMEEKGLEKDWVLNAMTVSTKEEQIIHGVYFYMFSKIHWSRL